MINASYSDECIELSIVPLNSLVSLCEISQYVIAPDGTAQSFSGVEPLDLVHHITKAMGTEDEEAKSEF